MCYSWSRINEPNRISKPDKQKTVILLFQINEQDSFGNNWLTFNSEATWHNLLIWIVCFQTALYTTVVTVTICAVNITWQICKKHDILQYLLSLWSCWILKTDRWWRKSKYYLMGETFPHTINNKLKVLSVSGTAVLHGW